MDSPESAKPLRERIEKLQGLEDHLRRQIRGQDPVLAKVASVLCRGELGLSKPTRPRGSFLFLGPTGVGKTETALAFTDYLYGRECLFRFDMSEYQTQESIALLIGGKLGERGNLALATDKTKQGTLLFDEIEKAHPRIMDLFLQILDAARVTMANGETLDMSGFYVVFTSNIGAAEILNLNYSTETTVERHVLTRAQQTLRPELFARITEKLVFHRLKYDVLLEIAESMLRKELQFLATKGFFITPSPCVLPFLVKQGFHPRLGARPMRDAIEKLVRDAIAEGLIHGNGSGVLIIHPSAQSLQIKGAKMNI